MGATTIYLPETSSMTEGVFVQHMMLAHPDDALVGWNSGHTGPDGNLRFESGRDIWETFHRRLHLTKGLGHRHGVGLEVPQGPTLVEQIWQRLDEAVDMAMELKAQKPKRGKDQEALVAFTLATGVAKGIAEALAILQGCSLEAIREESMDRWDERNPDGE